MSIFGEIERLVADLYPYRWPITIGALILLAAVLGLGYRRGWHLVIWRHKLVSGLVAAVVIAVTVPAGDYFLSPLWERSFLEEESPIAIAFEPDAGANVADTPSPSVVTPEIPTTESESDAVPEVPGEGSEEDAAEEFTASVVARGEFEGTDSFHFGRGQALLIETTPDVYTLRFENFSVRNGPDLFVYLSQDPGGYTNDALKLGRLKATDGSFNYEVPPGTDISQFKSALVWCEPFSVLFAVAPLVEA